MKTLPTTLGLAIGCRLSSRIVALLGAVCYCLLSSPRCEAAAGDEHWDNRFGWPGISNTVNVLSVHEQRLYAGGFYNGITNNQIDIWDGTNWSSIPGLSGGLATVRCLAWQGNSLYVGGVFSRAGTASVAGLARWDGTNWWDVGGFRGSPYSLAVIGDNLYAAGNITNIGSVLATNVACWNGSSWSAMGPGLGRTLPYGQFVQCLCVFNGQLYASGYFTNSGATLLNGIARWDGANWQPVGGGLLSGSYPGSGTAMAADSTALYVGGNFNHAGAATSTNIARWDGANWSSLNPGIDIYPLSLQPVGSYLYAGGSFGKAGGINVSAFARWNGSAWESVGGVNNNVYAVAADGANIYVGGPFTSASGYVSVNHVVRFDGSTWSGLGHGLGVAWTSRAVAATTNGVYVGGIFSSAGQTLANRIARWDGAGWWPVGSGVTGTNSTPSVYTILPYKANLYIGGTFTNACGVTAYNIAMYDARHGTWNALGSGADDTVQALASSASALYAGGAFTTIGGVASRGIAYWDGLNWNQLGSGLNSNVNAIAISGSDIYLGGKFTTALSVIALNRIALWRNNFWASVGDGAENGVNNTVNAIVVNGTDVYVGGSFTQAGSVPANRIAKWDGAGWSALGSGLTGSTSSAAVYSLLFSGSYLYAAGNFTNAGGIYVPGIARWDGGNWSALGSGLTYNGALQPVGYGLSSLGDDLYVAGAFYGAGGKDSYYFAHWNEQTDFTQPLGYLLSAPQWAAGQFHFRVTANPPSSYVIDTSTNLSTWQPWMTNTLSPLDITDTDNPPSPRRFYRARSGS